MGTSFLSPSWYVGISKADLRPFEAKVAAACADGSASAYTLNEEGGLDLVKEWKEPRLRTGQKYVGLAVSSTGSRYVYSSPQTFFSISYLNAEHTPVHRMVLCGSLPLTKLSPPHHKLLSFPCVSAIGASLPMRRHSSTVATKWSSQSGTPSAHSPRQRLPPPKSRANRLKRNGRGTTYFQVKPGERRM